MTLQESIFIEKAIRDLFWVVQSPLLIKDRWAVSMQSEIRQNLLGIVKGDEKILADALPRFAPNIPLGRWFESLLDCALRLTYGASEVHKSIPDGQGGELDFVVCNQGLVFHMECAVKYFLFRRHLGEGLDAFVGPGFRDSLDLKYHKMRDLQLRRAVPPVLLRNRQPLRVLWMSGRLFYPLVLEECLRQESSGMDILNPDHLRGEFGTLNGLFGSLRDGDILLELPPVWWITSLNGLNSECLGYFSEFEDRSDVAKMAAKIRLESGKIKEITRGFVG